MHWQVEDRVHCLKSVYGASKPLWVYVIEGDFTLWVDTGINCTPSEVLVPYLTSHGTRLGKRSQLAVITHADVDHFGGICGLRKIYPELLVTAHRADKDYIQEPSAIMRERYLMHASDGLEVPLDRQASLHERGGGGGKVDLALVGGEIFDLGQAGVWQVLHTPGHSAGHVILWNAARRWAIIGDALLDWGVKDEAGQLLAPPPYYDVPTYLDTLTAIRKLDVERMFTSHFGVLDRSGVERLLRNSHAAVNAIETAVHKALSERGSAGWLLDNLCQRTGEITQYWNMPLWSALADPISAHLKLGLATHRVGHIAEAGVSRYVAASQA